MFSSTLRATSRTASACTKPSAGAFRPSSSACAGVAERYPKTLAGLIVSDPPKAETLVTTLQGLESAPGDLARANGRVRALPRGAVLGRHGRRDRRGCRMTTTAFVDVPGCWICDSTSRTPVHDAIFDLSAYATQDPDLAAYSGTSVSIVRCDKCGFAQPDRMPALARYFDRMYRPALVGSVDRRRASRGVQDVIFADILDALARRLFRLAGGCSMSAPTPAVFSRSPGARVGLPMAWSSIPGPRRLPARPAAGPYIRATCTRSIRPMAYDAITLTDVLEHVPEPRSVLRKAARLLSDGGWIAIKVPNGPAQRIKERMAIPDSIAATVRRWPTTSFT